MVKDSSGGNQQEEFKAILLRACMNPQNFDENLEICTTHLRILGKEFNRHINSEFCYFKNHVGPADKRASKRISFEQSMKSLDHIGLELPYGMPICVSCEKEVSQILENEVMESESSDDVSDVHAISADLDATFISNSSELQIHEKNRKLGDLDETFSSTSTYDKKIEDENSQKKQIIAFNNFLKACEEQRFEGRQHLKAVTFDAADRSRQLKVMKAAARGISAILKTVSENFDDQLIIWGKLKHSQLVEKMIGAGPQMSADLQGT